MKSNVSKPCRVLSYVVWCRVLHLLAKLNCFFFLSNLPLKIILLCVIDQQLSTCSQRSVPNGKFSALTFLWFITSAISIEQKCARENIPTPIDFSWNKMCWSKFCVEEFECILSDQKMKIQHVKNCDIDTMGSNPVRCWNCLQSLVHCVSQAASQASQHLKALPCCALYDAPSPPPLPPEASW